MVGSWPREGRPVYTPTNRQGWPYIVTDGAGGAIVVWADEKTPPWSMDEETRTIYALRLSPSGGLEGPWPPGGRVVCVNAPWMMDLDVTADGVGGAIISFTRRSAQAGKKRDDPGWKWRDLYAKRIAPDGALGGAAVARH